MFPAAEMAFPASGWGEVGVSTRTRVRLLGERLPHALDKGNKAAEGEGLTFPQR